MADYRAKNRTSKGLDAQRKRLAEERLAAIEAKKPKYAMGGARGGMAVSPQGSISKFIESQVEAMVRDTAESVGQVSNEYVNQTPIGMLAKPFLGTDLLSRAVGSVNAGAGESMRGEVTPMDIINTASLVPLPAGVGAKVAAVGAKAIVPLAKQVGIPLAEGIKAAFRLENGLFEPAFAGVGNVGGALARTGAPKAASDALRYAPQYVAVGVRGANVEYATATSMANPSTMTTNATRRSNISQDLKKYNDTTAQRFKEAGKPPPPRLQMPEYKKMRDEALAANPDYQAKKLAEETEFLKKHGGDPKDLKADDLVFKDTWTVAHDFKKGLSGEPKHIISGEANRLEYEALTKDPSLKSYREVLEWAIKNKSQYKNYTSVDDLAKDLGMLHVI